MAGYDIVFFDIVCALSLIGVIVKRACLQREYIPSYDVIAVKLACAVASAFDRACYVIDAKLRLKSPWRKLDFKTSSMDLEISKTELSGFSASISRILE